MNNNKINNYLFLGMPGSGKTTYFSIMANHLQQLANRTKNLSFDFLPSDINGEEVDITQDFIDDCISRLEHRKWPKKTQYENRAYSFLLTKKSWLWREKNRIDYFDYPGDAFDAAFGDSCYYTEGSIQIGKEVKENVKKAKGVFLILDSNEVFNCTDKMKYGKTMTRLFRCIQENNKKVKLAIIFNKLELFGGQKIDFMKIFRQKYGNAFSYLKQLKSQCFEVYPLGEVETADDGGVYPPETLKPRYVLAPVKWMIGI